MTNDAAMIIAALVFAGLGWWWLAAVALILGLIIGLG